ncbi:MAG TPA: hypothetical protein VNF49_04220 [Candidatus Binataceae bacterium]|nr:hypothetical protein [Candidatus Binataceae bacterium]
MAVFAQPGAAERGSANAPASRLTRNSLLRYSPAVVLLAVLIADSNRHTDPDLWGQLRFGQDFLRHGRVLRHDPYGYSAPGHLWQDYEWLAQVVMALAYNAAGVVGLKLWKFVCTALTVIFIADTEAETGASPSIQTVVLLLASIGLVLVMQFWAQIFTTVLCAALLSLLARDNYRRDAPLWLAIPMMMLWANLHAGFFVGLVMLATYSSVTTLVDLREGVGWSRGFRLGAITGAAAFATLMNPYGLGMWQAVGRTLSEPYKRAAIDEWQPMFLAMAEQWNQAHSGIVFYVAVIALIAGLAAAFAITPRGRDLPLVAIAAIMAVATCLSVRNMSLAVVASSGPLARHLTLAGQRRRRAAPSPIPRPVNQWLMLGLCAALVVQGGLLSKRLPWDRAYPAGALSFMRKRNLQGNVLCEFEWGEYLIWHAAPADKIFVDGRYDTAYPPEVIHDYLLFRFDLPGGAHVLDAYPHDFVLISTAAAPARHLMERRNDWKLLYRDDDALLYARARASAASLPGLPVTGAAHPGGFP